MGGEFHMTGRARQGAQLSEMPAQASDVAALMDVAEASRMLRLSKMTILRRIRSGAWPGGRSGGKYLLNRAFVIALAAAMGSGRNVDAEDFAADWITRHGMPEAVPA